MSIFIIAEIGINHNGDMSICKELIDVAKDAGCDAVKFQKRDIDKVYTQELLDSPRESPWGTTQREQKEGLEFSREDYQEIDKYCKGKGIEWFASAWDTNSQEFLFVNLIASTTKLRPQWLWTRNCSRPSLVRKSILLFLPG